jgi:prepilin-type processing-associated H-X9-DG protein
MSDAPPESPAPAARTRKFLWPLLAVSAVLAALEVVNRLPLPCVAPVLGAVCAAFALSLAIRRRSYATVAAVALLVAHGALGLNSRSVWQRQMWVAILCQDLRSVGAALRQYVDEAGRFPPNLDALVRADLCSPRQLYSAADPNAVRRPPDESAYTSYVYQPGSVPWMDRADIVLLYEETANSCLLGYFTAHPGRLVLFADGHAEMLDKAAFRTALETDRRRRAEIGWPTAEPEPGVLAPAKP